MSSAAQGQVSISTGRSAASNGSTNRRVLHAAVIVSALTTLAKGAATVKELLVARSFGTSDALDAFLVAILLPTFAVNVVGGSFNTALIPVFVRVRDREGKEAAQRLLSNVMVFGLCFLGAVVVLLLALSGSLMPLLGSSFSGEKLSLAQSLFMLVLPVLILSGVSTTWSGVLNAQHRFGVPAICGAITPLLTIGLLVGFGGRIGVYSLALGMVAGSFLEAAILGWFLKYEGFSVCPRWTGWTTALRDVLRQYAPMAGGAVLLSSTTMIDQAMAAMLGPGQVSALAYGSRIVGLVLGIASMGIGTAVFPYFASMVAAQDWQGLRHTLKVYSVWILLGSIVLTILLLLFSEPLIRLLYERRKFTRTDTLLVSAIQRAYSLQIPFYLLGTLFVRLISSLRANQILMYGAVVSLVLDVTLNWLFIRWIGTPGIGLSTASVYLVSAIFLALMLQRKLAEAETARVHG